MSAHVWYVDGDNGNDSWDGTVPVFTSGTTGPKLTINGAEDKPVVAGDLVWIRPKASGAAYKEALTVDVSGSNPYVTGTVTVTQGAITVQGSGTAWSTNAFIDGQFRPDVYVSGSDGSTDGSDTFTSAGNTFALWIVGCTLAIPTKGIFKITARPSTTTLTLALADGSSASTALGTTSSLNYHTIPLAPIEILSVDSDTQLTLKSEWRDQTMAGVSHETWRDIKYVGDTDGRIWAPGGVVRISGSDNDQTATRSTCVTATTKNGRTFRGIAMDSASTHAFTAITGCNNFVVEDCHFQSYGTYGVNIDGNSNRNTMRRCTFMAATIGGIQFGDAGTVQRSNTRNLVDDCIFIGARGTAFLNSRLGGSAIVNCTIIGGNIGIQSLNHATGQFTSVANCVFASVATILVATSTAQLAEDCNCFSLQSYTAVVSSVTQCTQSVTYPALFAPALKSSGIHRPDSPVGLATASQIRAKAGVGITRRDWAGSLRPLTSGKSSWGALQASPLVRETSTVNSGTTSRKLTDAGDAPPIYIAVSNVSTTLTIKVRREANYAGTNPQIIIRQPGQDDIVLTDGGSSGAWNTLTNTWTPAATPAWVAIICRSNNTATSGSYGAFFDT